MTSGKPNVLIKWRFEHTVNDTSNLEVNKFVWCKKHSRKDVNGFQSGMYMPAPHNPEEWQESKTAGNTALKGNQKTRSSAKRKVTDAKPASKEKVGNLLLSKIFKTALATQVVFSDSKENHLVNKVMNSAFDDASNDEKSKYWVRNTQVLDQWIR